MDCLDLGKKRDTNGTDFLAGQALDGVQDDRYWKSADFEYYKKCVNVIILQNKYLWEGISKIRRMNME